jgi:hypothetical protein
MGLAGLGGAVFPSYIKLNPGGQKIHTLILNGAECEPWITCDDRLMRERAAEMLRGIEIMRMRWAVRHGHHRHRRQQAGSAGGDARGRPPRLKLSRCRRCIPAAAASNSPTR